jgi:hypothetical protein
MIPLGLAFEKYPNTFKMWNCFHFQLHKQKITYTFFTSNMGMAICDKAYSDPTHLPKTTISIHPNPTLLEKLQCYLLLLMGKLIEK